MPLALFSMYMSSNPIFKSYLCNGSQDWSLLLNDLLLEFASCLCHLSSLAESYYHFFLLPPCLSCAISVEAFGVDIRVTDLILLCLLSVLGIYLLFS